ncbi:GFA family protein [Sphingomonas montana]|uniref:GFA family protein n=1 Tax=Sphingomonas montana TaxID=1843236 RepID=UPI00096C1801|nr:GFA family protein [Sphingomonas montana]
MTRSADGAPIAGGCQCGAVRYLIVGPVPPCHACHCRECQAQSASAFGLSLAVARSAFAVTGPVRRWDRQNDLGARTTCVFCIECGTRVFHIDSLTPDRVSVKGGSLDDRTLAVPSAHIWVSRKLDWVRLDPGVPTHETQPADMAAWRAGFADRSFT